MATVTTAKILTELQSAGIIESWDCTRERDEDREVTETRFRVRSSQIRTSHEIYGRKAEMYFSCEVGVDIPAVHAAVRRVGGTIDNKWMGVRRDDCFSVRVSYFRGPRWWE